LTINLEGRPFFTLSSLADAIKAAFNHHLAPDYWVRTEIHKLNVYKATGHCYLELVEKSHGSTKAKMNATVWNTNYDRIAQNFLRIAQMPLTEGMEVLMRVQVRFHEVYGLSLNVIDIDPTFSMGQMARMRMETLRQLEKEGVIHQNKNLIFPEIPSKIAVVSAASSKGFIDFSMKVAEAITRYKFRIEIQIFPALLDGDQAVRTIPQQIQQINTLGGFDAICLIRGGGGEVGISAFDHIDIARAICTSNIPVIAGIGHATNETIAELVSNKHCITPTDVGNLLVQRFLDVLLELQDLIESLERGAENHLFDAFQQLEQTTKHFQKDVRNRLLVEKSTLRTLGARMSILPVQTIKTAKGQLEGAIHQIEKSAKMLLQNSENQLQQKTSQLDKGQYQNIKAQKFILNYLDEKLRILDPKGVLKRGYSITTVGGEIVTDAAMIPDGSILETQFYKGTTISKTIKKS